MERAEESSHEPSADDPRRRRSLAWLALAAFLAPIVAMLALRAVAGSRNDVTEWLPAGYAETARLKWFRERFAADQFLIMSWDGCELGPDETGLTDDPRLRRLAEALREAQLPSGPKGNSAPCFAEVTTGREALQQLTQSSAAVPYEAALQRLEGVLVGPDGKQTCVMATLTPEAAGRLRETLGLAQSGPLGLRALPPTPLQRALVAVGLDVNEVRLGGPPVDNVAIDEEGERTLGRLAVLSGAFGAALAWRALRSLRMTLIVFGCGVGSAAVALAIVPLTGGAVDAILMSMPALVYVLAVSGAIHLINYYRQALIDHDVHAAVDFGARHAWRPALLCSTTTALGLVSLGWSDIVPIQRFGLYSAAGVVGTLAVLFAVIPALLHCWPWIPPNLPQSEAIATGQNFWARFTHRLGLHYGWVLAGSFATILALCAGLPRVETTIDLLKLFRGDARLVQDYRWFEERLGRLVPLELVVRFPRRNLQEGLGKSPPLAELLESHALLERLDLVECLQLAVERQLGPQGTDLAGAAMSVATFTPPVSAPSLDYSSSTERYAVAEALLKHHGELEQTGFLRVEPTTGEELWRISLRVAAFHRVDHGAVVTQVQDAVEPVFAARRSVLEAVRRLAAQTGSAPSGRRVVLVASPDDAVWQETAKRLLANRRILAVALPRPLSELEPRQWAALRAADGVLVGPSVAAADCQTLAAAGVAILTQADLRTTPDDGSDVGIALTGAVPIVYKAQRELLNSLIGSTWWSFATITPLMMYVCRNVRAGMVVMIPNVLPVLVVFGGMGWLGVPVDIGSMMAASIALGVAVDDTIHFLAWFRDDLHRCGDRAAAVEAAYGRSATPTLQAALINGLGLSVFAVSSFTPTQRFGWLMLAILTVGVVAELIVLPALLLSPLGKAFHTAKAAVALPDGAAPLSTAPAPHFPSKHHADADVRKEVRRVVAQPPADARAHLDGRRH